MQALAQNLWLLSYPLTLLGADLRRNVAVIRLRSGDLVIHSTGPFTADDTAQIRAQGKPAWLLDAMLRHDTFAKQSRAAFPEAAYLAPDGFSKVSGIETRPLLPSPAAWGDELQVVRLEGVPSMEEHAVFHAPSRTLIVADLLFNFGTEASWWTHALLLLAVGARHAPGVSRSFKFTLKDRPAFERSLAAVMAWDFDRIIVGHGSVIERNGKAALGNALRRAGFQA